MAFEPNKWADGPEGETPITASELNRIEAAGAAKAAKGDKGDKGDPGTAGAKGDKGDPGTDGFPSEADWNALVARVDALEEPAGE